jgi:CRISPR-associated protein Cas5h
MKKLISFTVYAEKGFLKKPDINEGIYITYNMLHKPATLGILGAIIGLEGYKKNQELPEYYTKLKDIPIGIKPERHDKGNFQKTIITYNNTTGLASGEGNLIVTEQTLIEPAYTIFLLLDIEVEEQKQLFTNLKNQEAEYLPYLGKNDYSLWWDKEEVKEYEFDKVNGLDKAISIETLINKNKIIITETIDDELSSDFDFLELSSLDETDNYLYFENLPIGFNTKLFQYDMANFALTTFKLKPQHIDNLFYLKDTKQFIQLN